MNRLVIIGNGFDLAHGLKTKYQDFIEKYVHDFLYDFNLRRKLEDDLIKINTPIQSDGKINELISMKNSISILNNYIIKNSSFGLPFDRNNRVTISIKSKLLEEILKQINVNWVDIELTYFKLLKDNYDENEIQIKNINNNLDFLRKKLEVYLVDIEDKFIKEKIDFSLIEKIILNVKKLSDLSNEIINKTHVLNFNYTNTIENYISGSNNLVLSDINYIHGKLNDEKNEVIFGFGDEHNSHYKLFEEGEKNEVFKFIKSFHYFKNSNYSKLENFIDLDDYEVIILGHSCGLSDRTLLKQIFEHEKCKHIKIYYHKKEDGTDDYTEKTQNIARYFDDKVKMRKKIIPKDKCEPFPNVFISN